MASKSAKVVAGEAQWLGHPTKPIPITDDNHRDTRESTYVEEGLAKFIGAYGKRLGMSRSHVLRRLVILGAMSEGYVFDGDMYAKPSGGAMAGNRGKALDSASRGLVKGSAK